MNLYGIIVGRKDPVFVACSSNEDISSVMPLIATFDHNEQHYMILETDKDCIAGFRCKYLDYGIHLSGFLSDEESKIVRLALGMIVASLICQEGHSSFEGISNEKLSELEYFTTVAYEVMQQNSKDTDIIEEISLKSGLNVDEVICILLELSNIWVETNDNGGN